MRDAQAAHNQHCHLVTAPVVGPVKAVQQNQAAGTKNDQGRPDHQSRHQ